MSVGEAVGADEGLRTEDVRELLDRQTEVMGLVAGATPLPEVLAAVLVSLERLMPGARCSVLLLDRDRGTLHHGAAPTLPGDYVAAIDGMSIGDGAGSCGTAAALGIEVVAVDVRTDPRWVAYRHLAQAAGLRSCWSTPIEGRDGRPVGTFAVYHPDPHHPSGRERRLVERFRYLSSVAIDHAGLIGELLASEERFRRSFDDNGLGMAILDLDGVVTTSNAALDTLAGRGVLVGRELGDLVAAEGPSLTDRLRTWPEDDPGPVVLEGRLRRVVGDVEVEVTVSLLHDREGQPSQYVVNVLDLTERRAAERDRRARLRAETARRTAEELSHAKSGLLAAVGHEARTPMQAIVGFAELLGTLDLDEDRRREALGHITAAAVHVTDLLSDVLDLSRLEAGALPLSLESVPLCEVVDEVFGLLTAAAEGRDATLSHDLAADRVRADRRRLRQVLLNLVGNAIRHGRAGGHVEVRSRVAADPSRVVVTVDDDGPGIPSAFLPRVFTAYVRAEPTVCCPPSGRPDCPPYDESVGLGLGLAHGLAEAMDGSLVVGGSGPEGTSMVLRLPRGDRPPG